MHLSRQFEPFARRRREAHGVERVIRQTEHEADVPALTKVPDEQAGELGMDRQQDESGIVPPGSFEVLPSGDAGESCDELGRAPQKILEAPGSPFPSQQAQDEELAFFGGRQSEAYREVAKLGSGLGSEVPLKAFSTAKKLKPPHLHPMRRRVVSAEPYELVDKPLGAVEPSSIPLGEMLPEAALDLFDVVRHGRFAPSPLHYSTSLAELSACRFRE
jgi:hypothetical protein